MACCAAPAVEGGRCQVGDGLGQDDARSTGGDRGPIDGGMVEAGGVFEGDPAWADLHLELDQAGVHLDLEGVGGVGEAPGLDGDVAAVAAVGGSRSACLHIP